MQRSAFTIQTIAYAIRRLFFGSILLLGLGVAACGNNGTTTSPGSSAGVPQACGTISVRGDRVFSADTLAVENCFFHAYQQCKAATLVFHQMGVDTSQDHTLTIQPGNTPCQIKDDVQFHGIVKSNPQSYSCSSLQQQASGLTVQGCGDEGNLVIPSGQGDPTPPPSSATNSVTRT